MITKEEFVDKLEILEDGTIQERYKVRFTENGVILSVSYKRKIVTPDMDPADFDVKTKKATDAFWDAETVEKYKDKKLKDKEQEGELIQ